MEKLRKKETEELYRKITIFIRKKLLYMLEVEEWQGTEIAEKYGFASNRQSEIKNPAKYPEARVGKPTLKGLIGGGFVTTKEMLNGIDLNEKEGNHIKGFAIYEKPGLHAELLSYEDADINPVDILKAYKEEHPEEFV